RIARDRRSGHPPPGAAAPPAWRGAPAGVVVSGAPSPRPAARLPARVRDTRGDPRVSTTSPSAHLGRGMAHRGAPALSPRSGALSVRRYRARPPGADRAAHDGRPVRGDTLGVVQLGGAREVDLHGAVPRAREDLRDAADRVRGLPLLRARSVVAVSPARAADR